MWLPLIFLFFASAASDDSAPDVLTTTPIPLKNPLISFNFPWVHFPNLVDKDVNPCDNFYRHVCKGNTSYPNYTVEVLLHCIREEADEAKRQLEKDKTWLAIMNIKELEYKESPFNPTQYQEDLARRCGLKVACYFDEYTIAYEFVVANPDIFEPQAVLSLAYLYNMTSEQTLNKTKETQGLISDLTSISRQIANIYHGFEGINIEKFARFYGRLHKKTHAYYHFLQETNNNNTVPEEVLQEVIKIAKTKVKNRIKSTSWATELTSEFGVNLSQFLDAIIDEIPVQFEDVTQENHDIMQARLINFTAVYHKALSNRNQTTMGAKIALAIAESASRKEIAKHKDGLKILVSIEEAERAVYFSEISQGGTIFANYALVLLYRSKSPLQYKIALFANDLVHQLFRALYKRTEEWLGGHEKFQQQKLCVQKAMVDTCNDFKKDEGRCMSGKRTVDNDVPLLEYIDTAYQVYKDFLEWYPSSNNTKLTNIQGYSVPRGEKNQSLTDDEMFFYSIGSFNCLPDASEEPLSEAEHKEFKYANQRGAPISKEDEDEIINRKINGHSSAMFAQINGLLRQTTLFQDVFKCGDNSPMSKRQEHCSIYGDNRVATTTEAPSTTTTAPVVTPPKEEETEEARKKRLADEAAAKET